MGHQIIKQPNGLYALYSSVVDDFILIDATPQDIIDELVSKYKVEMQEKVYKIVNALDKKEKPYYQFTMSFDEAVREIKHRHGANSESLKMLGITKTKESVK